MIHTPVSSSLAVTRKWKLTALQNHSHTISHVRLPTLKSQSQDERWRWRHTILSSDSCALLPAAKVPYVATLQWIVSVPLLIKHPPLVHIAQKSAHAQFDGSSYQMVFEGHSVWCCRRQPPGEPRCHTVLAVSQQKRARAHRGLAGNEGPGELNEQKKKGG